MKCLDVANTENFEVLCIHGRVKGIAEKVVVVAVYPTIPNTELTLV